MKFIDNNLEKQWYREYAEGSPIFLSLPAHAICEGIISSEKQYKGVVTFYSNNKIDWFTLEEDQDVITSEILENYHRNKNYYQKWFLKWRILDKKFDRLFQKVSESILSAMTERKLFDLHGNFWEDEISSRRVSMLTEPFTFGAERLMAQKLQTYCTKNKISNFPQIYANLTLPEKSSFLNRFNVEIIKIARKIKNDNKIFLLAQPKKLSKLPYVKKHLEKYRWIRVNWGEAYQYTEEMLAQEIKDFLTHDLTALEKEKLAQEATNSQQRRAILQKYSFPRDVRALSDLSVFFTIWHDLRKENALKFIYGESLFLKEFSRRFKLKYQDLKLFDITEIEKVLKNRPLFQKEVIKRKTKFLVIYANRKVYFVFGKKVQLYYKKLLNAGAGSDPTEIKGMTACSGIVLGRAKVVHEKKEFSKFLSGDILVTGMTRPDFVPLMKKAAGIITDEGGVTCHAAIISRELNKPCIIGTKIATKILKDGDLVEVDADKGIVRKI